MGGYVSKEDGWVKKMTGVNVPFLVATHKLDDIILGFNALDLQWKPEIMSQ